MKLITGLLFAAIAVTASAQAGSAFKPYSFTGLTVTASAGDIYTVTLAQNATVTVNGAPRQIRDIFGFYLVATSGEFTAATSAYAPNDWAFKGPGGNGKGKGKGKGDDGDDSIGWTNQNKSNSLRPGNSFTYDFSTLTTTSGIQGFVGVHVRLLNDTTFHARVPGNTPVPEPASMAVLGLGLAGLARRRRAAKA